MTVRVMLFAAARELAGADEISLDLPHGASFGDLRAKLTSAHPKLAPLGGRALFAADAQYSSDEDLVPDAAEIALIPPVSGG